ncbi:UNVERIFIED_ORG: adenylosuccinate lyase [Rhizobium sp. SORGH_AS260]|uniref:Adenylosuccinate lyase n=5 Tax=Hyphomicrobiales TaxID=356 RepID=U4PYA8_9HYPH|nr:adenylosuccinate lyase [Rhizobium sp. SORGH_AS_0285]MDP9754657.1 adenylosuccinate lyase [Rhizobium sp. SORGH_AS_0260]MDP9773876.1 adenylosuccinate lyase [Rhizobium sp. SORGH_AS_0755]MDR6082690.1 adenylosuccinate lyase [Agrobacterium sp. SORGH_AS_0440]MDR6189838.1 adenylosuccinate lyase [Agrobacterium pusense]CAD7024875.1 adenylosuccinate lyase [Rhizobium sp. P007]CUW88721.1 Adenylosuccinate lyase (Adenylosuccinase) (ASL) [Agrobacterium genomosp. 2 str. CFBP 5494]
MLNGQQISSTKKVIAMIPRYSRPEMVAIWSPETKFRIWFEIEAHACDALAELGVIPKSAAQTIWEKGGSATFDVARIDEIEAVTKHDVIAFLTHLAEFVGPDSRFVHQGMTSSDVLDTTLNIQLVRAADLLLADMDRVLAALKTRAFEHKNTVRIGRSHGIHAEPTTMGLTFARFYAEMHRNRERLVNARAEIATGAISGAVGTFANIDPRVEEHVCEKLGLIPEPVSTQVIPRDRHAMFFATLGVIASSIENVAIEIRHMQRTEVLEAEEFFSPGQKGSSAMPHKRNPVLTENLTGLARLVRMSVVPAMENVALWHERDISHSSVERAIGPDTTVTLDFALNRLAGVIEKLVIYPDNMLKNMNKFRGLVHSQRVLLALTQAGVSREDAYRLVQRNAMKVWEQGADFLEELLGDEEVRAALPEEVIREKFDLGYHTKHVDTIFARVFGNA